MHNDFRDLTASGIFGLGLHEWSYRTTPEASNDSSEKNVTIANEVTTTSTNQNKLVLTASSESSRAVTDNRLSASMIVNSTTSESKDTENLEKYSLTTLAENAMSTGESMTTENKNVWILSSEITADTIYAQKPLTSTTFVVADRQILEESLEEFGEISTSISYNETSTMSINRSSDSSGSGNLLTYPSVTEPPSQTTEEVKVKETSPSEFIELKTATQTKIGLTYVPENLDSEGFEQKKTFAPVPTGERESTDVFFIDASTVGQVIFEQEYISEVSTQASAPMAQQDLSADIEQADSVTLSAGNSTDAPEQGTSFPNVSPSTDSSESMTTELADSARKKESPDAIVINASDANRTIPLKDVSLQPPTSMVSHNFSTDMIQSEIASSSSSSLTEFSEQADDFAIFSMVTTDSSDVVSSGLIKADLIIPTPTRTSQNNLTELRHFSERKSAGQMTAAANNRSTTTTSSYLLANNAQSVVATDKLLDYQGNGKFTHTLPFVLACVIGIVLILLLIVGWILTAVCLNVSTFIVCYSSIL